MDVATLLVVLLARLAIGTDLVNAAGMIAADQPEAKRHSIVDQAIDFMLDAIESETTLRPDLRREADAACRMASLLDGLEQPGPAFRPSRKSRVDTLRRTIDTSYRARFTAELDTRVVQVCEEIGASAADGEVEDLERTIRELRRFEAAARRLGGCEHYDRNRRGAAARLAASDLPLVDRARLVELVDGPEAALALLASP